MDGRAKTQEVERNCDHYYNQRDWKEPVTPEQLEQTVPTWYDRMRRQAKHFLGTFHTLTSVTYRIIELINRPDLLDWQQHWWSSQNIQFFFPVLSSILAGFDSIADSVQNVPSFSLLLSFRLDKLTAVYCAIPPPHGHHISIHKPFLHHLLRRNALSDNLDTIRLKVTSFADDLSLTNHKYQLWAIGRGS